MVKADFAVSPEELPCIFCVLCRGNPGAQLHTESRLPAEQASAAGVPVLTLMTFSPVRSAGELFALLVRAEILWEQLKELL